MSEVLKEKMVPTKKDHQCWGCLKVFPANTQMLYQAVVHEGSIASLYTCTHCRDWIHENTYNWGIDEWESVYQGDIGRWKDGIWYPQQD